MIPEFDSNRDGCPFAWIIKAAQEVREDRILSALEQRAKSNVDRLMANARARARQEIPLE